MSSTALPSRQRPVPEREQLDLFRALPGDMAPRDSQDLMAFPFFSLAKSRRVAPIDFRSGNITIRVEGTQEHGIATIWDADILIWAASQLVEARDAGIPTSRLMRATPFQILRFIGRGTSLRDALLEMTQKGLGMTVIVETDGRLAGIFTDGDLRRALDKGVDVRQTLIDEVMTVHGKTANAEMLAAEALKIMEDHKISSLVVIDEQELPIGALNMHDLLRAGVM